MEYRLKLIDLHTLETWSLRLHVESKITPRFLGGSSLGLISWSPTLMEICKDWLVLGRDVITNSSVLSSFSLEPCDLEIWHMTLKNNRAPLLCYFKLLKNNRAPLLRCFRTLTPVWIHIWQWNHAHSWKQHRRGALLFFKVIRQISRSHGSKNRRIWPRLGVSGL